MAFRELADMLGVPAKIVNSVEDITARQQQRQKQREAAEQGAAMEQMGQGVQALQAAEAGPQ